MIVDQVSAYISEKKYRVTKINVCPGSSDPPEKYLIYLHHKMRFTPFINYYDTLG